MTTTSKPFLPMADIDRDLFGMPVQRPRDDRELLGEAIDGLRELILDDWRTASDETLEHHFHDELGGAEGAIREFGYHFELLDREDMLAFAIADLEIAMKAEIEFWANQH